MFARRLFLAVALVSCAPDDAPPRPGVFRHVGSGWVSGGIAVTRDGIAASGCRFRTASINGVPVSDADPIADAAHVTFARGAVREVIRPYRSGVEQTWTIDDKPAGPIEIVVHVDGTLRTNTPERTTFDCPGGAAATYGAATFVDAHGRRTPVLRELRADTIVLHVPRETVAAASFPAIVDPIVAAETPVEAPVGWSTEAAMVATRLGAATDHWLLAWKTPTSDSVWLNRIALDGTQSWPTGVRLDDMRTPPALSFDGTNWLVTYSVTGPALVARRIAPSGAILDVTPIVLSTSWASPAAAWDGTHHVIIAASKAYYVSPAGTIDASLTLPSTGPEPRISCSATGDCLVLWPDVTATEVHGVRLSSGVLLDATPRLFSTAGYVTGMAWSGSGWLVLTVHDSTNALSLNRIGTDGAVLGTTPIGYGGGAISCSKDDCRIAYSESGVNKTVRTDKTGVLLDTPAEIGSGYLGYWTRVACTVGDCLVWGESYNVSGFRMRGSTSLDSAPRALNYRPNLQLQPVTASSNSGALIVWNDLRGSALPTTLQLYGTRVSVSGSVSPAERLVGDLTGPAGAAFDGTDWLLASMASRESTPRIIRLDGALAPLGSWTMPVGSEFDLACSPVGCIYGFRTWASAAYGLSTVVWSKGAAPGPASTIVAGSSTSDVESFAVAAGPDGFLALAKPTSGAFGAIRLTKTGALVDTTPIALPTGVSKMADVAFVEGVWMVAWAEDTTARVHVARLSREGALLDDRIVATSPAGAYGVHVTTSNDGHTALASWCAATECRGAFVAADGRVLDPGGFVITTAGSGAVTASSGPGKLVVSYVVGDWNATTRVYFRTIDSGALDGASCSTNDSCSSRYCVDGYCCDQACTGACKSCGTGKCSPVLSADDADSCTGSKTCSSAGTCGSKDGVACAAAMECASGFCVDGVCCEQACTDACKSCGTGKCVSVTSADDTDSCTGPKTCSSAGSCGSKNGVTCTAATDCASGFCVDGVCCESTCDGVCEACNVTGALGTCSVISGAPIRGACPSDPSEPICGVRTCDGVARSTCEARPGAETICAPQKCEGGIEYGARQCSAGACTAAVTRACSPYVCGSTGVCATTCADDTGCAAGRVCVGGACVEPSPEPPVWEPPTSEPSESEPSSIEPPGAEPPDEVYVEEGSGCGCRTAGSRSTQGWAIMLAVALAYRRRADRR